MIQTAYSSVILREKNIFSRMKISFYLKSDYKNKEGKSPLYLTLINHGQRKRLSLDIFIHKKDWDAENQKIKNKDLMDFDFILNDIRAKINKIQMQYRLIDEVLTVDKCAELLTKPDLTIDFIKFMEAEILLKTMESGTVRAHNSILSKLREYSPSLLFADISGSFIAKYRKYLAVKHKNNLTTIDSNIKTIKHYLNLAKKRGVILNIDTKEIKIRQHKGNRVNLSISEVEKMKEYLFSGFISDFQRLILAYFVFNCMTGQRINDLMAMERIDLEADFFTFWNKKSKKNQILMTNETCRKILEIEPELFKTKLTPEYLNREIKVIAKFLGIRKHVTCHVARHTFATNYLRKGGKVEDLQILLGHADIKTTMIYVHMVESDTVKTMTLLD